MSEVTLDKLNYLALVLALAAGSIAFAVTRTPTITAAEPEAGDVAGPPDQSSSFGAPWTGGGHVASDSPSP